MYSLWRENYSKYTQSLSYKIAYFHSLTHPFALHLSSLSLLKIIKKKSFLHCFPQKAVYL